VGTSARHCPKGRRASAQPPGAGPKQSLPGNRTTGTGVLERRIFDLRSTRRSVAGAALPDRPEAVDPVVSVLVSFSLVQPWPNETAQGFPSQVRTPTNPAGPPHEDLESVLGATPHEFESRILRTPPTRADDGPDRTCGRGHRRSGVAVWVAVDAHRGQEAGDPAVDRDLAVSLGRDQSSRRPSRRCPSGTRAVRCWCRRGTRADWPGSHSVIASTTVCLSSAGTQPGPPCA
jgi:hypothetical protein